MNTLKPFDLEAAKRGEPIVRRDGIPCRFLLHVPDALENCRVIFLSEKTILSTREDGRIYPNVNVGCDLFMAPKKRKVWVNVFAVENPRVGYAYDDRIAADDAMRYSSRNRIACIEVEFKEGQGL